MSVLDDVTTALQAVQEQLDAALAHGNQAMEAAERGRQLAAQVGSKSTTDQLEQLIGMIRALQTGIADAQRDSGDVISTAQAAGGG